MAIAELTGTVLVRSSAPRGVSNYAVGDLCVARDSGDVWVLRRDMTWSSVAVLGPGDLAGDVEQIRDAALAAVDPVLGSIGPGQAPGPERGIKGDKGDKGDTGNKGEKGDRGSGANVRFEPALLTLPLLNVGSSDHTVTWPTAWPDASYQVRLVLDATGVQAGRLSVTVKTKTPTSVTITATVSTAAVAAGARVWLFAYGDALGVAP